jgi:mRNA interferase RelE/StbE
VAWAVEFEARARREFDALDGFVRRRIVGALERLAVDPTRSANVKALSGRAEYRLRVGDYRVLYVLRRERLVVLVVEVGHRREIYR